MNNLFNMYCRYKYIRKEMIKYINFPVVVYPYVCVFTTMCCMLLRFFYSHVLCYSTCVRNRQKLYLLFVYLLSEACPQFLQFLMFFPSPCATGIIE